MAYKKREKRKLKKTRNMMRGGNRVRISFGKKKL